MLLVPGIDLWFIVKLLFLFAFTIYIVFAAVVVRQTYLMTSTVRLGLEFFIKALAWAHLFVALGVFLFAFIIL